MPPSTGVLINASLVSDLHEPRGLALADGFLYVTEYGSGRIGKYDATTGAKINDTLVSGLASPQAVAISGNNLFVTSLDGEGTGMVGKYDATTGAAINPALVSRLQSPLGIAVADGHIFVVYGEGLGTLGEGDANSGGEINSHLVPNVLDPDGLVQSGNNLWVAFSQNSPSGMVMKFSANTGRNALGMFQSFIKGINYPSTLALSGNDLFVASPADGTIGKYNATTGEALNTSLVSGLRGVISGIAAAPSTESAAVTPSLRDQLVLTEKVYRLDDVALLLWRNWYVIVAIFAVIGLALMFVVWKMALRRGTVAPLVKPVGNLSNELHMKPILIGFAILGLLMIGAFFAYQMAMSFYISKLIEMKSLARKEVEAEQTLTSLPPPKPAGEITRVMMPPVIIDSENF